MNIPREEAAALLRLGFCPVSLKAPVIAKVTREGFYEHLATDDLDNLDKRAKARKHARRRGRFRMKVDRPVLNWMNQLLKTSPLFE